MDFKEWQKDFDNKKWMDSIVVGQDTCGSYEFCVKCKKEESSPCARAFNRFKNSRVRIAVLRPRS